MNGNRIESTPFSHFLFNISNTSCKNRMNILKFNFFHFKFCLPNSFFSFFSWFDSNQNMVLYKRGFFLIDKTFTGRHKPFFSDLLTSLKLVTLAIHAHKFDILWSTVVTLFHLTKDSISIENKVEGLRNGIKHWYFPRKDWMSSSYLNGICSWASSQATQNQKTWSMNPRSH